ncbi:hypothetical protein EXIGLDRAFT_90421 [Exidia glandulosa HHB12029]|uniref:Uncharacterized protein n=1 Tax=Exidia glandulosa HHB12029 TaxID=1314781 RepID=A0A165HC41_EXIGL|nr:hypothetical protein EXIGLDRAFT_90421 [Exidia glandulosa HHB12029]
MPQLPMTIRDHYLLLLQQSTELLLAAYLQQKRSGFCVMQRRRFTSDASSLCIVHSEPSCGVPSTPDTRSNLLSIESPRTPRAASHFSSLASLVDACQCSSIRPYCKPKIHYRRPTPRYIQNVLPPGQGDRYFCYRGSTKSGSIALSAGSRSP